MKVIELNGRKCLTQPIPSDGNCLFGAVAHQIFQKIVPSSEHRELTRALRELVVQYISDNLSNPSLSELILLRVEQEFPQLKTLNDEAETLRKFLRVLYRDGVWGASESLLALAMYFECDIVLHREHGFTTTVENDDGTGKTTIVKRLVDEKLMTDNRIAGFYTEEIRNSHGNRIGFDIVSLDATSRGILARNDGTCKTPKHKVGRYAVDTLSLDTFLQPFCESCVTADILVIDEIGKMELKSDLFTNFISEIIGKSGKDKVSYKIVIATVPIAKSVPIVEKIKSQRNSRLFTVTKLNRNDIFDEIKMAIADGLANNA